MRRIPALLALIGILAAGTSSAADQVRLLEVNSLPLTTDGGGGKTQGAAVTRPTSVFVTSPVLTRQSATLKADGTLQMRCDGGSPRNFATVRRNSDQREIRPRVAQP